MACISDRRRIRDIYYDALCQRQRFIKSLRMARISVDELDRLLQNGEHW